MIPFSTKTTVAYFSMEICLEQAIPTYSGGLGVLAGDTLRSAADLGVPMVGVTLLHRKGYFEQHLDAAGSQTRDARRTGIRRRARAGRRARSTVMIEGRTVHVRAWQYDGARRARTRSPGLPARHRSCPRTASATARSPTTLYGGDEHYRLCQEIVLGMGGAAMLARARLHRRVHLPPERRPLGAAHAAAARAAARRRASTFELDEADLEAVRRRCVFTTHTPVPAGHDKFPARRWCARCSATSASRCWRRRGAWTSGMLNMTHLALRLSRFVNGVAMRHREVSRGMFPDYPIDCDHQRRARDDLDVAGVPRRCSTGAFPSGARDNLYLRYAVEHPARRRSATAHAAASRRCSTRSTRAPASTLDPTVFTIGFARRATPYKRADLIFTDLERLRADRARRRADADRVRRQGASARRRRQGAHPPHLRRRRSELGDAVAVVYLENYEMALAAQDGRRASTSGSTIR